MRGALHSLYICYLSLEDPLVQTQVVAYLEGLVSRGHAIHLLTFEPRLSRQRKRELRDELRGRGIEWRSLRYHKRPSLPATLYDSLVGAALAMWMVRRHGLDAIHARSHVPAAMGLIARRLGRCKLIFDIRGLLADEYADAGRWRRDGLAYRITTSVQRRAIEKADGIVVLTERVRAHLFGPDESDRIAVIPCCVSLDRMHADPGETARLRSMLALEDRRVMVYVGKLTAPYMDREMVEFFAIAHRTDPRLAFLVLTQAPPASIEAEFRRAGLGPGTHRIARTTPERMGSHLALADFAISFCYPTFARIASSPTKTGEYLGAGLPVVSGPNIGDTDAILARGTGVVLRAFGESEYMRAAAAIQALAENPAARERCRAVAREVFSLEDVGLPRYDALYRRLAPGDGT